MTPSVRYHLVGWFLCVLFGSGVSGCGYQLVGAHSDLAPMARSIAIALFDNRSQEPGIEQELANAIRNSFLADGRFRLNSRAEADLLLVGKIYHYALSPLSFNRNDHVLEYQLEIDLEITLMSQATQQILLKQRINPGREEYLVNADIAPTEVARALAIQRAFQEVGNQVLSLIIDGF